MYLVQTAVALSSDTACTAVLLFCILCLVHSSNSRRSKSGVFGFEPPSYEFVSTRDVRIRTHVALLDTHRSIILLDTHSLVYES